MEQRHLDLIADGFLCMAEESRETLIRRLTEAAEKKCESEIEKILFVAYGIEVIGHNIGLPHHLAYRSHCSVEELSKMNSSPVSCYADWMVPQAEVGKFRCDLALKRIDIRQINLKSTTIATPVFIVECDGHDFHERTKEQAEYDRSRDRAMQAMGLQVLRFTGREIWRDPVDCAIQIDQAIENCLDRIAADLDKDPTPKSDG